MLLLLSVSIASWTFIFQRSRALSGAREEMRQFEDKFWSGADLNRLYQELSARNNLTGMGSIFCAGFKEFAMICKDLQGRGPKRNVQPCAHHAREHS